MVSPAAASRISRADATPPDLVERTPPRGHVATRPVRVAPPLFSAVETGDPSRKSKQAAGRLAAYSRLCREARVSIARDLQYIHTEKQV